MKTAAAILTMILLACFLMPQRVHAYTEDRGGSSANGALIGAAIGVVIATILYIVSVASETPMDKQKSQRDNEKAAASGSTAISGNSIANLEALASSSGERKEPAADRPARFALMIAF